MISFVPFCLASLSQWNCKCLAAAICSSQVFNAFYQLKYHVHAFQRHFCLLCTSVILCLSFFIRINFSSQNIYSGHKGGSFPLEKHTKKEIAWLLLQRLLDKLHSTIGSKNNWVTVKWIRFNSILFEIMCLCFIVFRVGEDICRWSRLCLFLFLFLFVFLFDLCFFMFDKDISRWSGLCLYLFCFCQICAIKSIFAGGTDGTVLIKTFAPRFAV